MAALRAHVVTAVAVLLRDPVAVHHRRTGGELAVGRNRAEDLALAAKVEAHNPERNLRLVAMGKHLERGNKAGVRDHVRSQLAAVVGLRPILLRLAVHRQHQHGMVRREIGGGVVAAIAVCAYGYDHIRMLTRANASAARARRH